MKVLVLSSFFPSSSSNHLPQFLLEQAIAFAEHRPDIEFTYLAASNESSDFYQRISHNLKIYRFNYFWPRRMQILTRYGILAALKHNKLNYLLLPFLFIFEYFAIRKLIRQIKPDIVYSHWMLPQGLLAYFLTRNKAIKHALTSHSSDIEALFKIPLYGEKLGIKVIKHLTAISVVSHANADKLKSLVTEDTQISLKTKLAILPMGINTQLIKGICEHKSNQNQHDQYSLLFMGRLTHKKGIFILLEAVKKLVDRDIPIRLVIAGNGILKHKIETFISINQLSENVEMVGFIADVEKQQIMADANIFILPSISTTDGDREGLPVSLLENMAVGNTCIATYGSGAEDVINDAENGYLINPGNSNELAQKIAQVLVSDEEESLRINENAVTDTKKYRWESLIKDYSNWLLS